MSHRLLATVLVLVSLVSLPGGASAQTSPAPRRVRDALTGEARIAFERASVLFEDGDHGGARAEFARAFDRSNDPRILYNVAVCDKMLRKYTRAIEGLERSLALGGTSLPADYVSRTRETIATLAPYVSTLAITADQEDATILVDGEPVGTTPLAAPLRIEVGEHLVAVRKAGFLDVPKRVRVTGGEQASAAFAMEAAVTRAELSVTAAGAPPGTKVMVLLDGVEVGLAPFRGMVESGPHTLGARAPGFAAAPRRVELVARQPASLTLALESDTKSGRLRVRADEDGDVIELDGATIGRGSVDRSIPVGEHRLRVVRAGVPPRELEFVIGENETRTVSLSLEKKGGVPAWVWLGGGALLAGGATVAIVLLTRRTEYSGSSPGTLDPRTLPATFVFRGP